MKVRIKAFAEDENGNRSAVKDAVVNLSLIDEALLALSDQSINPLEELYRYVPSGFHSSYSSHSNMNRHGGVMFGRGMAEEAKADMAVMDGSTMNAATAQGMELEFATSEDAAAPRVRSEFKDTALFITLHLDETGSGELSFTLPDNVTGWRMTGAAVSDELKAGSQVEEVNVSLPFFLNTSISRTYLVGDKPLVGVTAYGSGLDDNELIRYSIEVYDSEGDEPVMTGGLSGTAFERVNLPLGTLEAAGDYRVIVKGLREDGTGDALEMKIEVVETYHEQVVTDIYPLQPGMRITTNDSGNTLLTFIDEGRGYYLPGLYRLSYSSGKRVDQKYLADVVRKYLNEYFAGDATVEDVSITEYMAPNGGIAILPYAEADIETTVNMLPLIKNEISTVSLSHYLQNAWYDRNVNEKGAVLYGLILLGEPVLQDLNTYARVENLSDRDRMYLSLAYAEIGDRYLAESIYEEVAAGRVEEYEERGYLKVGDREHDNLELTAMAMVITDKLGLDIHDKYYDFVRNTYSKEVLVNTWMLQYIFARIDKSSQTVGSLTYEYNSKEVTLEFEHGYPRSVRIPSATLKDFNILEVKGDMAVVAAYDAPLTRSVDNDGSLKVTREYINYQTGETTNVSGRGTSSRWFLTGLSMLKPSTARIAFRTMRRPVSSLLTILGSSA